MPNRLTGHETLAPGRDLENPTILDFWQWAFSDLRANNIRGVFAEWLVAKLLQLNLPTRDSWAGWDLETPEGVKIEVKTSAYLQSWMQKRPSAIIFGGLQGRTWDPVNGYSDKPVFQADLYVFCVHTEKDAIRYNSLDLKQWRFYLLLRDDLAKRNVKSLSLKTLVRLTPELTAREFRHRAAEIIHRIAATPSLSRGNHE